MYPVGASQVDRVKLANDRDPITITALGNRISVFMAGVSELEGLRTIALRPVLVHGRTKARGAGSPKHGGGNSVARDGNN